MAAKPPFFASITEIKQNLFYIHTFCTPHWLPVVKACTAITPKLSGEAMVRNNLRSLIILGNDMIYATCPFIRVPYKHTQWLLFVLGVCNHYPIGL